MSDIPTHVGFILDGNRRWAREHGLPKYEGHLAGYNAIKEVSQAAIEAGVEHVSIYAFSTENWKRSESEVKKLMALTLKSLISDLHIFQENNIRLRFLGSREGLNAKIVDAIEKAEAQTSTNTAGNLSVCFNYGGETEIVDAVKKIVQSGIHEEDITADLITKNIYSPEIPQLDLIVRTSGEQRLSGFMLWRAAYAELLFLDKNWPEMTKADVTDILERYAQRQRRFGR